MGKGKSLGDDFVERRETSLFLNCKLLNANYGLYSGWFGTKKERKEKLGMGNFFLLSQRLASGFLSASW